MTVWLEGTELEAYSMSQYLFVFVFLVVEVGWLGHLALSTGCSILLVWAFLLHWQAGNTVKSLLQNQADFTDF
jgi:hypothetical protein